MVAETADRPERTVVAGYAVACVVVAAIVGEMLRRGATLDRRSLAGSWQLIDLGPLVDDPFGSIWYLHTQPPLHNLVVGSVLRWSPFPGVGTLFVLYATFLLITGLLLVDLLRRWGVHPVLAGGIAGLALTTPSALRTVYLGSYEVPLATLVVLALWLLGRHLDRPRPATLVGLSVTLTTLVLVRSLFHPVWLAAVLALVVVARPLPWRSVALAMAVPLLLIGGWMVKNQVLFGEPTLSSWLGFNLQRGAVAPLDAEVVDGAIADGTATPLAQQQPWLSLDDYPGQPPCDEDRHPAVADVVKPSASVSVANFNSTCYLPLYAESRANASALAREDPGGYLRSRQAALTLAFGVNPLGEEDPEGTFAGPRDPERTWMDVVGDVVLLPVATEVDMRSWNLPLLGWDALPTRVSLTLVAGFLVVVARGAWGVVRLARSGWAERASTWAADDVLWVVLASVAGLMVVGAAFVEIGENDRFRATVDPLLLAAPLGLVAGWLRTRRHRSAGGTTMESAAGSDPGAAPAPEPIT